MEHLMQILPMVLLIRTNGTSIDANGDLATSISANGTAPLVQLDGLAQFTNTIQS